MKRIILLTQTSQVAEVIEVKEVLPFGQAQAESRCAQKLKTILYSAVFIVETFVSNFFNSSNFFNFKKVELAKLEYVTYGEGIVTQEAHGVGEKTYLCGKSLQADEELSEPGPT